MQRYLRHIFPDDIECPWIRKNDGVRTAVRDLFHCFFKYLDIRIPREDIHREQSFTSILMQVFHRSFEIGKIEDFILSHPQRGEGYANIDFFCSVMARDHGFLIRSPGCDYCWFMHKPIKRLKDLED